MKSEYLRAANERSAALQAAEEYLNLYPEDEKAIRQAGLASAENKLFSKAIKYFSDNIEKHPSSAQNFTDRANVYLQIKSWDAAEYDYSMSLDLWPRNGDVYYNKGLALMQMGKVDQACHDFRMALRYGNNKASGMISRHCIK